MVVKIEVHLPEGFNVYCLISHDKWALLSNWHQYIVVNHQSCFGVTILGKSTCTYNVYVLCICS